MASLSILPLYLHHCGKGCVRSVCWRQLLCGPTGSESNEPLDNTFVFEVMWFFLIPIRPQADFFFAFAARRNMSFRLDRRVTVLRRLPNDFYVVRCPKPSCANCPAHCANDVLAAQWWRLRTRWRCGFTKHFGPSGVCNDGLHVNVSARTAQRGQGCRERQVLG